MRTEVLKAVRRTRRSLNAITLLSGGLLWLSPAAVAAGLLLLFLEATGRLPPGGPALAAWGIASALAFCGGALAALRRRLDDRSAAAWLDGRLGTRELLSAALGLSAPDRPEGRFDEELAERAEALAATPAVRHPGWPLGGLLRRALPAAAACLALPAILAWADPLALGRAFRPDSGYIEAAASRRPSAGREGATVFASGADVAAVARFLFAEDPARADAAERALREGRVEEFRNLLERSVKDLDSRLSRTVGDSERDRLLEERRRIEDALAAIDEGTSSGSSSSGSFMERSLSGPESAEAGSTRRVPGEGGSAGDSSSRSPPRRRSDEGEEAGGEGGSGKAGSERESPGAGRGGKGAAPAPGPAPSPAPGGDGSSGGDGSRAGGPDRAGGGPGGTGEGSGGGTGGSGSGDGGDRPGAAGDAGATGGVGQSRSRTTVAPQAAGGILTVAPDRDADFYDFVLKGQDPGSALQALAAQAARASEAPIANEGLPLEYEDFLRSYFLALVRQLQESGAAQEAPPATKGEP